MQLSLEGKATGQHSGRDLEVIHHGMGRQRSEGGSAEKFSCRVTARGLREVGWVQKEEVVSEDWNWR